jgi:hypothetical protein
VVAIPSIKYLWANKYTIITGMRERAVAAMTRVYSVPYCITNERVPKLKFSEVPYSLA